MFTGLKKTTTWVSIVAGIMMATGLTPVHSITSSHAANVINPDNARINVEVSKGTLIKLKHPANNVFIADPDIADIQVKSPTLVYVYGKKQGETSIYAVSEKDTILYSGAVTVHHNLGNLREAISSVMPDARIDVKAYQGLLVLTGHVDSPEEAEEARTMAETFIGKKHTIINRVNVATPTQVNLRVKIAEVGRDTMKQLGFNWESFLSSGNATVGIFQGADVFDVVPSVFDPTQPVREIFTGNQGTNSIYGSFQTGNLDINGIIDALEEEGVLSVLAEPNLTALSGEQAKFLAGGEYPIPTLDDGEVVIDYKEFGVSLEFMPTVLDDKKINLKVKPEVSELSSSGAITLNGFNIPALSTRRAETTVELGSGQSFAIAGLLQNTMTRDLGKIPGLGDLPILGALFQSDRFQRRETELVIIVTPYIVRPHKDSQMALPTDGLKAPTDLERYLKGKPYKSTPQGNMPSAQSPKGQSITAAGFMLN
ncbi:MAG: hypothetical protein CMF31_01580 [Kordiimonas sp.]|nr:hypothetical protein [Kordiimonas sp.]